MQYKRAVYTTMKKLNIQKKKDMKENVTVTTIQQWPLDKCICVFMELNYITYSV